MSNDMERERFDHLTRVEAAAEKMVKCKGRYHSELNMIALAALFGVKLPPPVATPAPAVERYHPDASHVRPDYRDGWNACCDAFERATPAEAIGIPCPTAPERIWLQVDPYPDEAGKPVYVESDDGAVTWKHVKVNETDTMYVRADLVAPSAPSDQQGGRG